MIDVLFFAGGSLLVVAILFGIATCSWQVRAGVGRTRSILAIALGATVLWSGANAQDEGEGAETFAFEVEQINEGLPPIDAPLRLDTPRAALESFLDAIRQDEFGRAAYALNLSAVPAEQQAERAPELALMLAFVLRRYDLIDWSEIPDQPDARVLPGLQQSTAPYTRRSVELGEVEVGGRPVPISLQRFRTEDDEAVWLFSPYAVERVTEIFAETRPGLLSRWVPLQQRLDTLGQPSLAEWVAAAILLAATILVWLAVYYAIRVAARHLRPTRARAARKLSLPLATLTAALALRVGINSLILLTGPIASKMVLGSEAIALAAGAWLLIQGVSAGTLSLSERYVVPLAADDPENRRIKTTVYVARRMALVAAALLSVGYILVRVGLFESFGVSVLASAGALGVLVAIAARPLLGNMVAGLQIALTDPLRIGDVVVYDGHWATVEDISFAHTVLRTWTETRLIVPHADFLSRPFENWSKEGDAVRRIVKIPVDFRIDVDVVRRKVREIVEGDPRSVEAPLVELVEVNAETAVIWIWLTGTTAFTSWYLHNDVREKLMAFLKDHDDGAFLPRRRYILVQDDPPAPGPVPPSEQG
ncbi:Small-conductance mechanosensitive channel [Palleronia marisminoris]|uniref:Mechanosensitive channel MscK n=1 Tax=Palleronia marisminoris TaxID=315423 RepID=A0A1Y5SF31_9RHOB|nr:mechanosensitive ion channel domain-containing protein [Palleronia marisminoris]SFG71477.1 Small-conductance mechanosensitive channel [Palleronia marisminoris]SLN36499.1 Mechanosensitive channel MscK precursor [Palleronia marisminoris]